MRAGRTIAVVAAGFAVLIGFGLTAAGGVLTWIAQTQTDTEGFVTSPERRLTSDASAIVVDALDLRDRAGPRVWMIPPGLLTLRLHARAAGDGELFLGVAPADRLHAYLGDTAYDVIEDVREGPFAVGYRRVSGGAGAEPPWKEPFWTAQARGSGHRVLEWDVQPGDWALVAMNADGGPGVDLRAAVGLRSSALAPLGIGLLIGGVLVLLSGVVVLAAGLLGGDPAPAGPPVGHPPSEQAASGTSPVYPLTLHGTLDPTVSRGLWLVKWAAALPHAFVLMFLWVAFAVATVLAGVAILFTGRYPRGLFDFNVGVMRWTWRVAFYTYGVGATDRYPPFTLAAGGYPADLDVAYPERLSRGLVLVKWLLAFPHLVIAGVFAGGGFLFMWPDWRGDGPFDGPMWGGGVIGVLVLVSLVVLLFSRAYPSQLFDLVMGLNRWTYRVGAYVGLMTDVYPPFRLDQGPDEPNGDPAPVPPPEGSRPQVPAEFAEGPV